MVSKETELFVLNRIYKYKDMMFGYYHDKLMEKDKIRMWEDVFNTEKSSWLFDSTKD
jgi:hypothetical protein